MKCGKVAADAVLGVGADKYASYYFAWFVIPIMEVRSIVLLAYVVTLDLVKDGIH